MLNAFERKRRCFVVDNKRKSFSASTAIAPRRFRSTALSPFDSGIAANVSRQTTSMRCVPSHQLKSPSNWMAEWRNCRLHSVGDSLSRTSHSSVIARWIPSRNSRPALLRHVYFQSDVTSQEPRVFPSSRRPS